jgi:hypothetical protein
MAVQLHRNQLELRSRHPPSDQSVRQGQEGKNGFPIPQALLHLPQRRGGRRGPWRRLLHLKAVHPPPLGRLQSQIGAAPAVEFKADQLLVEVATTIDEHLPEQVILR